MPQKISEFLDVSYKITNGSIRKPSRYSLSL